MSEEFSPALLLKKREAAGLTRKELAKYSNVSIDSIRDYEYGRRRPLAEKWRRLQMGLQRIRTIVRNDTWREPEPAPKPEPPRYEFEPGHQYSILDHYAGGKNIDGINPQYGTLCVFRYEGKAGIHHCFREENGGWTRTYTDAQLVGKKIKEVTRCGRT